MARVELSIALIQINNNDCTSHGAAVCYARTIKSGPSVSWVWLYFGGSAAKPFVLPTHVLLREKLRRYRDAVHAIYLEQLASMGWSSRVLRMWEGVDKMCLLLLILLVYSCPALSTNCESEPSKLYRIFCSVV